MTNQTKKQVIFSGIQPSGNLHIGNYLGAIKNWIPLQENNKCIFCVVDYHAITVKQDPEDLRKKILEVACTYLASGIDPEKSTIFIQSQVKEHTELAWILNTIAKISELERMTQFKDKAKAHKENVNVGLFDYPVLMAADILLYKSDLVPVGQDQKQHIEIARTLAERFNNIFGKTFVIPEPLIKKEGAKIMGLDDPARKMSKSAASPKNYISLIDSPETIRKKIKSAATDSGSEILMREDKPAISNLLTIYHLLSGKTVKEIEKKYENAKYSEFKNDLAEITVGYLSAFQNKLSELEKNQDHIKKILAVGAEKARSIARETMKEVKEKIGLVV